MQQLATDIRARGAQAGLWLRVLQAPKGTTKHLLNVPRDGLVLDPSRDEVLAEVQRRVSIAAGWGYGMLKHDFTTFDCFGKWGFAMGGSVTDDGWAFADTTRTSAEIISALYTTIRQAAGQSLLIGCNTIGHLAAGTHEIQRTGDDTSGRAWERTRRMGPNTLAMRMPQHGSFFCADADCVGITPNIPWHLNHAWLDAVATSGTALFVSPHPDAVGSEQDAALRQAFATAASAPPASAAIDWRETTAPQQWRTALGNRQWQWDHTGSQVKCPG
jgi:alpha-galactosidase